MEILYFLIIIAIMFASCFVLPDIHAQDCMGGPFCGGNKAFAPTLNRNVTVSLNFHSNYTLPNNVHYLWLRFFDAKNNELIKNVSFFINSTKDNKVLMHELFYTKTGFMLMKFHSDSDTGKLIINGTSEPTLGGMMSENDTLPITTSVFATNGTYHIHLEVLTIDYPNNIIDQSNPPTFDSWWLVDEKGNISKYDNHAIGTSLQLENNTVANKIQSPLQQFKSGIALKDITCAPDLQLVIKAKNRSPACVKLDDVSKLVERGWADKPNSLQEKVDFANVCLGMNDACRHSYDVKSGDPFGITALIVYHPPDLCLNLVPPSNNVTVHGCPPNTFYLKINSASTAYLTGYNICDGDSCTRTNDISVLLPIKDALTPNFQMIGLPVDLKWKYDDTVGIQLYVSPTNDNKTASLVDIGNSTIVP
ncbi:MAG: hypothetical protein ACRDRL_16510 [Sciscionella sp.]